MSWDEDLILKVCELLGCRQTRLSRHHRDRWNETKWMRVSIWYYIWAKFRVNRINGLETVMGRPKFYRHTQTHIFIIRLVILQKSRNITKEKSINSSVYLLFVRYCLSWFTLYLKYSINFLWDCGCLEWTTKQRKSTLIYQQQNHEIFFFNWLFTVALTARSYRDCHWFSVWEWYFIDILETHQSQMRFFLIHGRHLSGRDKCSHRATTAMWTTMSSDNPIYHERHLSGRVQCSHRATAMSNVVTRPLPMISIVRPGNLIYELLTVWVQITLPSVGELKPPFSQQWYQITRNCKH